MPNPPLWTAIVAFVVKFIFKTGPIHHFGDTLLITSLIIWSYLEVTKGINWFRKLLGAVVLLIEIASLFSRLK